MHLASRPASVSNGPDQDVRHAWLLAGSGHDTDDLVPPTGGRAPGWPAGLTVAARGPRLREQPAQH
jgi:hypothetical protein